METRRVCKIHVLLVGVFLASGVVPAVVPPFRGKTPCSDTTSFLNSGLDRLDFRW